MDNLKKRYRHYSPADLENIQEEFSSGIRRALDLVTAAFQEELDLDGHSQLMHMTAVSIAGQNDDERLVGILHDIVEDTACTFDDLLMDGFPKRIVDSLRLLTHDKETPYMDYVKNICESGDKVALAVKLNDLNHNLKRGRAGGHWQFVEKHEKALAYIQEFMNNNREDEHR
jgi:(p)ppGpp synthase/HD superfamily hydrolase